MKGRSPRARPRGGCFRFNVEEELCKFVGFGKLIAAFGRPGRGSGGYILLHAMVQIPNSTSHFSHVQLPRIGKRVLRLGVAASYGLDARGLRHAAERGVGYWLWSARSKQLTPVLRDLLARDRERHVVAVLSGVVYTAGMVRRGVEAALRALSIDQVDLYQLPWLGRMSRFSPAIEQELERLKGEGKLCASGTSIHDRPRAGRLVRESSLDAFMIRYNAKHPGAEQDVFPHRSERGPLIVAYTATSWRQLTRPLAGLSLPPWPGAGAAPPMSAGLCYRFCLSNPHVHLALSGPANQTQLDENLDSLAAGPLCAEEDAWVREYGRQIKAKRRLDFI